ncbi:MAG: hypothetical protein WBW04_06215 [Nitrolancea sp.]
MTAPSVGEGRFRAPVVFEAQSRGDANRRRLLAWVLVRVTGVLLSVLVLGHFAMTHIITDVSDTGTSFIARRWASSVWLVWDALLLLCAVVHGASGVWVAIDDYAATPARRRWTQRVLVFLSTIIFATGTAAIVVVGRR